MHVFVCFWKKIHGKPNMAHVAKKFKCGSRPPTHRSSKLVSSWSRVHLSTVCWLPLSHWRGPWVMGSAGNPIDSLASMGFHRRKVRAQNCFLFREDGPIILAVFSFLYLKKKFKNICQFWNISKIYPGRPPIGRQAQSVIFFFFRFATKSLEKKKAQSPVGGGGATGACRPAHGRPPLGPAHGGGRGRVAPPRGRQGGLSPSLLIWARKFHQKSRKKERSEEKKSGEALPDSTLVISRLVHLV